MSKCYHNIYNMGWMIWSKGDTSLKEGSQANNPANENRFRT